MTAIVRIALKPGAQLVDPWIEAIRNHTALHLEA